MADKNWSQIGDEIEDMVRNALETKDFGQLSQNISRTVGEAMENVGKSVQNAVNKADAKTREAAENIPAGRGRQQTIRFTAGQWKAKAALPEDRLLTNTAAPPCGLPVFSPAMSRHGKKTERIFYGSDLKIRVE
ncbi:MAG: hypothetical protein V8S22_03955 [Lachnospiraceae bacterium]